MLETPALPARQLGNLNEVAAGVVELGDDRAGDFGRRHGEGGAARFDALVVALDVVSKEHDRGLALLEKGMLVGLGAGLLLSASCSSVPSASSGEATVSQRNGPLLKSAFLVKPSTS